MGVAKFDDGTPDNPKMAAAGPVACWLWFCGVLYCRRALTDGFIPKGKVPGLIVGLSAGGAFRQATKLCDVGLWHEELGGYRVHDYLDWNPTKAAIENYRKRDRDRKHQQHGIHAESITESDRNPKPTANARAEHAGAKSESESKSERSSDLTSDREEIPTGDPPPVWRPPIVQGHTFTDPLFNGREARVHGMHAWCGRICVSIGLHADFQRRLGGDDADARLKAWYPTVMARHEGRPLGDDLFDFWRNEFAAWVGTVTSRSSSSRTGDTMDAGQKSLRDRLERLQAEEGESHVQRQIKG